MPATDISRIDGLTTSVAVKAPCHAATTANITLANLQTIDGIVLLDTYPPYRVLVKDQNDPTENGIYNPRDSTAWSRALDFDGQRDARNGTLAWVNSGDTNVGLWKVVSTADPIVIDVDELTWEFVFLSNSTNSFVITNERDGGGDILGTGFSGYEYVPWGFEILGHVLMADVSGNLTVGVAAKAYADDDPPVFPTNSITGATKPTLAAQQQKLTTTLTDWDTEFAAGTTGTQLVYNIDSNDTATYYKLNLICRKTP